MTEQGDMSADAARSRRFMLVMAVGLVLLLLAIVTALRFGSTDSDVTLPVIRDVLLGKLLPGAGATLDRIDQGRQDIVWLLRTPRALVAAMVGAMLALAGVLLQAMFRNPLAAPGVIGISQGAALGAALAMISGLALRSLLYTPLLAFLGALAVLAVIALVIWRMGAASLATLLLVGIAINFLLGAVMSLVISMTAKRWDIGQQIIAWTMGGIAQSSWRQVAMAAPCLLAGGALCVSIIRDLDLLLEGEETARSLGVHTVATAQRALLATAILVGGAVAVSGVVGFVGLVVPHCVRLIIGPGHRRLVPAAALTGAWFLLGADLLARTIIRPEEIQLGIITAAVGSPLFLFLLLQQRKETAYL